MRRIALTGGIATGKSYVLEQFRRRGVPCLDADALVHGIEAAGTESTRAIAARFGPEVIGADGAVDRTKLGRIVFDDDAARRELEAIVHPAVYRAIAAALRAFEITEHPALAIVDIPLLFETAHAGDFDKVIATLCPPEMQVARLLERGLSADDARRRLAAQLPAGEKAKRADFVVRTDGSFASTDTQVDELLRTLRGAQHG